MVRQLHCMLRIKGRLLDIDSRQVGTPDGAIQSFYILYVQVGLYQGRFLILECQGGETDGARIKYCLLNI